jgi:hypothetical protein
LCCTVSMAAGEPDRTIEVGLTAVSSDGMARVQVRIGIIQDGLQNGRRPVAIGVDLAVKESVLVVPRSAYADLIGPRRVSIDAQGPAGVVIIQGGDGADAYVARLYFDRQKVTRRTLSSALLADKPTEETRYSLRVMKDE